MTTLRSKVIRLAYAKPELRPHLLPILEKKARGGWDKVISGPFMRCRVSFGSQKILIEELPGKPVKRQVRKMSFSTYDVRRGQWFHGVESVFLIENIFPAAHISPNMTYDKAVGHVWEALYAAVEKAIERAAKLAEEYPGKYHAFTEEDFKRYRVPQTFGWEESVSWLEVEPKDYKPISFHGKDFGGTSEWGEFKFYEEAQADEWMAQMEGMRAVHVSTSAGAARKLFKLLKADPTAVQNMTAGQFEKWLIKHKIGFKYIPTVWR